MIEVKVDGVSCTTISGCQLTTMGEAQGASPRFREESIYGRNGKYRALEAYDEYDRKIGFHCESFEAVTGVIALFQGMGKKLEFWHLPGSFFYFDFKSSEYRFNHKHSWDVTVTVIMKPFRYLVASDPVVLTRSGSVVNPGDVASEPVVTVFGQGAVSLTIGRQVMRLNLDTKAVIDCRQGRQTIFDKTGQVRNTLRTAGGFFDIPIGTSGVVFEGNLSRVEIEPGWRYRI